MTKKNKPYKLGPEQQVQEDVPLWVDAGSVNDNDDEIKTGTLPVVIPAKTTNEDYYEKRTSDLEAEIQEKYNEKTVDMLQRLAYEVSVIGLRLEEACLIVEVDYEKLLAMIQADPLIERLIKTKDLQYKRKLIKTVSIKASTDDRIAMTLLQSRYPDEFNKRKGGGSGEGDSDDLLGVAIEFIQKSGDNTPLVNERSAKISVVKKASGNNEETVKQIKDILK
jgi:hypothetical protein